MSATMPRRDRPRAIPRVDLGPRIAGELRRDVVVVNRADPDDPNRTIRAASRRAGYDWLHARGVLSDAQREAADRYCVAHERAAGAKEQRRALICRVRTLPSQQGHPTEAQLAAVRDIERAHAAIRTRINRAVLDGVVLEGRTLDDLAARLSEPVPGVVGRLRALLDILADEWGID